MSDRLQGQAKRRAGELVADGTRFRERSTAGFWGAVVPAKPRRCAQGLRRWTAWLVCLGLLVPAVLSAVEVEVVSVSGEVVRGELEVWTTEQLQLADSPAGSWPVEQLARITFPEHTVRPVEGDWLILANGDRLALSVQQIRDDRVTAERVALPPAVRLSQPLLTRWAGPLESVAAVVCQLPASSAVRRQWLTELNNIPAGHDVLQFLTGERLTGELTELEGLQIAWTAPFGATTLDRRRVRWIRLDPELGSFPPRQPPYWWVWLTDGSRLTVTAVRPGSNQDVELTLPLGDPVHLPWNGIWRLQQITPRHEPLSSRQPLATTYTPYLAGQRSLQVDRNVLGGPLMVRGEESAVGLGMCSAMTATYAVQPGDETFRTAVGIDDAAEGRGSARFRIWVDDRLVWESEEVTGRMPRLEAPPVPLRGARALKLEVAFGAWGDVADYANWCDALVLREAPSGSR